MNRLVVLVTISIFISACQSKGVAQIVFESDRDGSNKYYVLNIDEKNDVVQLDLPFCDHPLWAHHAKMMACPSNETHPLLLMDNNGVVLATIGDKENEWWPMSWSPNNSTLALVSNVDGNDDVYIVNSDGTGLLRITSDSMSQNYFPLWSPTGKFIAFRSLQFSKDEIVNDHLIVITVDGKEKLDFDLTTVQDFSKGMTPGFIYSWSPDGKMLGLLGWKVVDINSGVVEDLLDNVPNLCTIYPPEWSPNGQKILFQAKPCSKTNIYSWYDIYVINRDGSNLMKLTSELSSYQPHWSPDGTHIVFNYYDGDKSDIYMVRDDGTEIRNITNNPSNDIFVEWLH